MSINETRRTSNDPAGECISKPSFLKTCNQLWNKIFRSNLRSLTEESARTPCEIEELHLTKSQTEKQAGPTLLGAKKDLLKVLNTKRKSNQPYELIASAKASSTSE